MNTPKKIADSNINGRTPLRPHQVKAVKAVINEFLSQPRTKYIAACGTGKTMVGLHVAEALKPRSVIVFLPSLALIRQTLIEWSREKMFNGNYANLFVCSDQTITDDLDSIVMTEEEFGHPITTDSLSVKRFLKVPSSGVKLIFSTYNSARVLAEGTPSGFQFDFSVMDEAHRTAGPAGKPFGVVLDDTKLPIKKRLFLTATPRLYKVKKAVLDSEVLSYSMDSPKLYGTTADRLPFKNAVEMNLITPYEILASVITSADIDRELLEKELLFNNKPFDAKRIANLVSIKDAVRQHDIKKIFTFHGRIEDAREFVEAKNPPIQDYLPDFKIFHINGAMPMEKRNRIMEEFRLAERALISNAKVLSEGIDVPSVDLVTFMCPKKSTVDIVQAVGRVSRNHPGKKAGYVLLPLFLDQLRKETEDEAFDRTEFSFMWNIFKAMKSEDDTLDLIIRNESMKMGETGDGYIPDFKDKIRILGSSDTLEAISRGIKTMIIETVGEGFDYWLGLLKALIQEQGEYGTETIFRGKNIGRWITYIRKLYKLGILTDEQISSLNALNFIFDAHEYRFEETYDLLASYKAENGHCLVKNKEWYKGRPLGNMVANLRSSKRNNRKGVLSEERIARLDAIGMVWNPLTERFIGKIKQLIQYKKKHNHLRVSQTDREYKGLGNYITKKRMDKRMGTIPPDHERILTELGLDWEPLDEDFEITFDQLNKYYQRHGHTRVPASKKSGKKEDPLSFKVRSLRQRFERGTLSREQIQRLKSIQFDFSPVQADFDYGFSFLARYYDEHGHTNVPIREEYHGFFLGRWSQRLRMSRKRGKKGPGTDLTNNNIKRLDALNFPWDLKEIKKAAEVFLFEADFKKLAIYKKKRGHCNVTKEDPKNRELGLSVACLRKKYQAYQAGDRSFFRPGWIDRLNSIGFDWSPKYDKEQILLGLLIKFKKKHHHFDVPTSHRDPDTGYQLGRYVGNIKIRIAKNKLSEKQKAVLKKIGFPIKPPPPVLTSFETHYPALAAYHKKYGNVEVPGNFIFQGKNLGQWVDYVRRRWKEGKINTKEKKLLDKLSFRWGPMEKRICRRSPFYSHKKD